MSKNVIKIEKRTVLEKPKRVAAYARVSSGKDAMLHSLSTQVSYYNELIQVHEGWQYAGVYADEALTGTKEDRADFQRLLSDCRSGLIDLVITKSISRFARNTVTLLQTVRELKSLGVGVFFEEQNIHTMNTEGELMLTILASYAQEESLSASENQKWRIKKNFERGIPWNTTMLGYRLDNGKLVIEPYEAEIVKSIYADYLTSMGVNAIMKKLNANGVLTRYGNQWNACSVNKVLTNYAYTGNLILQKTFRENHLTKQKLMNNGELPKYHVEEVHEAIIPLEEFDEVQAEMERRATKYYNSPTNQPHLFTDILICGRCGNHYRRKITKTGVVWICGTFKSKGKSACASKQVPESTLQIAMCEVVGSVDGLNGIDHIRVENGNKLTFCFHDGNKIEFIWQDRSRADSWTDDMRKAARDKYKERILNNAKNNDYPCDKK